MFVENPSVHLIEERNLPLTSPNNDNIFCLYCGWYEVRISSYAELYTKKLFEIPCKHLFASH